jgi:hypothetical protein
MTPTSHNKLLGVLHLAYGALTFVAMIFVTIAVLVMIATAPGDAVSSGVFALIIVAAIFVNLLLPIPSLIAGYGLLKRKRWARTMGIVAGIVAALTLPFGIALCVYTLWFMFGERGRFLYHSAAYALPEAPAVRKRLDRQVEQPEYTPPPAPPDWR